MYSRDNPSGPEINHHKCIFFQVADLQSLLDRLSAIEEKQKPTVSALKRTVVQHMLRKNVDFDKYKALEFVDQLRTLAMQLKDPKADYLGSVYTTLLDKMPHSSPELFKTYILSLLGDRDYEKIIETINKVDKSFASKTTFRQGQPYPQPLFRPPYSHSPQRLPVYTTPPNFHPATHSFQDHTASYIPRPRWRSRHCSYCGLNNHTIHSCYKKMNNKNFYSKKNQ